MPLLIPAILAHTPEEFTEKFNLVSPYCRRIQVDLMDGQFVNNTTISIDQIPRFNTKNKLELHLMMNDPLSILQYEKHPNITAIIFHFEAVKDIEDIIKFLPKNIIKGVALNPETPVRVLEPYLKILDLVLLMSVYPGFAGQQFIPSTLMKIAEIRGMKEGLIIEVDGGISKNNAADIANAGADQLVVGSHIYRAHKPEKMIKDLKLEMGDIEGVVYDSNRIGQ